MTTPKLTHFDDAGHAQMVDVGHKDQTRRIAVASGLVYMETETLERIRSGTIDKGDVLGVARIAAIQGIKRTAELIPLCHPLRITHVAVGFSLHPSPPHVAISARIEAIDRTGVEMEALTAVTVAALTIYDMCKAIDRGMRLGNIQLEEKHGGKSGSWRRNA